MSFDKLLYTMPLRLRSLFRRNRVEQDLSEELAFHLEERIGRNMAAGMDAEEARREARRAMEGFEQSKEACRDVRGVNVVENLGRDLRYGLRMLRKNPAFTAVAVLSLALGIGANTAIFSLINTLLLRPLPVERPAELRTVFVTRPGNVHPDYSLTYPIFDALRRSNTVFSSVFAWSGHHFQMRSGEDMVHVNGTLASGDYFTALGVKPVLGRTFTVADDFGSGGKDGPVAVISYRFWVQHFSKSPRAIGSGLLLDKVRFTVIGVMPPEFFGTEVGTRPEIWVPLSLNDRIGDAFCMSSRSCWWLTVMGRVRPGLEERKLDAGLKVISPSLMRETLPPDWPARQKSEYLQLRFIAADGAQGWTFLRTQFQHPLLILMALVGLVLLIACANLANLLLARASARGREIAVRLSLGAARGRVIRQLLTESVLLSFLGAAAGTLFAFWLTRLLVGFLTSAFGSRDQGLELDLRPDWRVVLFTALAAGCSGLLFGLAPALRATREGIASTLKESTHNIRRQRKSSFGRLLLPLQAALSVLLVAAAGLFAGSLFRLLQTNPGFNPRDVAVISVDTAKRLEKKTALTALYGEMLERVQGLPGVEKASLLWSTPLTGMTWDQPIDDDAKKGLSEDQRMVWINPVGPHFFDVMQIRLLAGRQFASSDTDHSETVAVLNEVGARRFFPGRSALGEQIRMDKKIYRIVGVAGNIKYGNLREPDRPELYLPYTQNAESNWSYSFVLKLRPGAQSVYPAFRSALHEIAPDVPSGAMKNLSEQLADSIGKERLMASLSVFFGLLALLLTSIGLYGALAYDVARRTGEIGLRMALGARAGDVVWLVLRDSAFLVAGGVCAGVLVFVALSKMAASLLFGIHSNDPRNLIASVMILLAVALAAAAIPATRAARLDPTISLRQE